GPTRVTSAYAVPPMNATSVPPMPTIDFGRPLANVVITPVLGSTREILPAADSVTYSAPPGPTVLPEPPSRPVSSWVGLGAGDGGAALAADGVIAPTANRSSRTISRPPCRRVPVVNVPVRPCVVVRVPRQTSRGGRCWPDTPGAHRRTASTETRAAPWKRLMPRSNASP